MHPTRKIDDVMPNEAAAPISRPTIPFPGIRMSVDVPQERGPGLVARAGIAIGVLMARPEEPKGWGWNPSVITLCILVGSLLAGGGYYIGRQASQIEMIQKQADEARKTAQDAKDLILVPTDETPTPTPKKGK